MRFFIRIIRKLISNFTRSELQNFRFLLGQSAILSSRANSSTFEHLWDAEVKVYSQWGEDGILDFLCEKIGFSKPKMLEIGAGNFSECNSRFLAEIRNASVYAVDGREDLIISIDRNSLKWKNHIFGLQTWVTPDNINKIIFQAQQFLGGIDIFSLDLDGNDYWILKKANLEKIAIIIVEYNPLFGYRRGVSVPENANFSRGSAHYSNLYYGASLKAFEGILTEKGFVFIGTNRVGNNAFFIHKDFESKVPLKAEKDYSIYTDWRVRESRAKDGTLTFASGRERLSEIKLLPVIDVETAEEIVLQDAID